MTIQPAATRPSGPGGIVRLVGVLSVLMMAVLGGLAVVGALSIEDFSALSIKLAMLSGIALAACVSIWALTYRRG